MALRIGIDALFIRPGKVGGTESYLRNLLKGLERIDNQNEYFIFASKSNFQTFNFSQMNFKVIMCNLENSNRLKRIIYTNLQLPKMVKQYKLDIMFFPSYMRCVNNIDGVKIVSNVHDIQYKHFPEYFSLLKRIVFGIFYPISLKKSSKNICISNFVKEDIKENFKNMNLDNFQVIYNPIDFQKFDKTIEEHFDGIESRLGIKQKNYILSVASLLPHKNITTLIKAFDIFKKKTISNYKLVLVGIKESSTGELTDLIERLQLGKEVIIPGFVSDSELSLLYNNASIFVSTSLFEGFGMPPVEAMYRNIPVITTRCASLPEVTLGKAIYYNEPKNHDELANVINETLNSGFSYDKDVRKELISKYSLENVAKEYKKFFEDLVKY